MFCWLLLIIGQVYLVIWFSVAGPSLWTPTTFTWLKADFPGYVYAASYVGTICANHWGFKHCGVTIVWWKAISQFDFLGNGYWNERFISCNNTIMKYFCGFKSHLSSTDTNVVCPEARPDSNSYVAQNTFKIFTHILCSFRVRPLSIQSKTKMLEEIQKFSFWAHSANIIMYIVGC